MNAIEIYYYIFYKVHNAIKNIQPKRAGNKFKAIMMISFFEFWLITPFYIYSNIFLSERNTIHLFSFASVPFIIIVLIKWFAFIRNDTWQYYEQKFDQWPPAKNLIGSYAVTGLILFIILHVGLAAYLASIFLPESRQYTR